MKISPKYRRGVGEYFAAQKKGRVKSVLTLIEDHLAFSDIEGGELGFSGPSTTRKPILIAATLVGRLGEGDLLEEESDEGMEQDVEKRLISLGLEFIEAADSGKVHVVEKFVNFGFPVNFRHPRFLDTAMHRAAGCGAPDIVRTLDDTGKVDYLIRDAYGKCAYENWLIYSSQGEVDPDQEAAGRLLYERSKSAALNSGVDFDAEIRAGVRGNIFTRLP